MADRKTIKAGMIQHKGANVSIQLNVDRDSSKFWADVFGERIEHAEGAEVKRLALEAIERAMDVPWTPIIIVSPWNSTSTREYSIFGFSLKRVYYADLPNDVGLRQVRWDAKAEKRLDWSESMPWQRYMGEFKPPCVRDGNVGMPTYYLPYSEAVWDRLSLLQRQIEGAGEEFEAILRSPDALRDLAELRGAGLMALPAPAESVNDGSH